MPTSKPPYPVKFPERIIEPVRAGQGRHQHEAAVERVLQQAGALDEAWA